MKAAVNQNENYKPVKGPQKISKKWTAKAKEIQQEVQSKEKHSYSIENQKTIKRG